MINNEIFCILRQPSIMYDCNIVTKNLIYFYLLLTLLQEMKFYKSNCVCIVINFEQSLWQIAGSCSREIYGYFKNISVL